MVNYMLHQRCMGPFILINFLVNFFITFGAANAIMIVCLAES